MNLLRRPSEFTRLSTITALGRHPSLFYAFARLSSHRDTLVTPETGICVEGPPRCANSFFVTGFGLANPEVRIAHHHHVPAQIRRAVEFDIPAVALLRNPLDSALAKAAPSQESFLIGTTLRRFISFWRDLRDILGEVEVARFEDITTDPGGVISRVNRRWGRDFSTEFPAETRVFKTLEMNRIDSQGAVALTRPNPNIPNETISNHEDDMRPLAEAHSLATVAMAEYRSILDLIAG